MSPGGEFIRSPLAERSRGSKSLLSQGKEIEKPSTLQPFGGLLAKNRHIPHNRGSECSPVTSTIFGTPDLEYPGVQSTISMRHVSHY